MRRFFISALWLSDNIFKVLGFRRNFSFRHDNHPTLLKLRRGTSPQKYFVFKAPQYYGYYFEKADKKRGICPVFY